MPTCDEHIPIFSCRLIRKCVIIKVDIVILCKRFVWIVVFVIFISFLALFSAVMRGTANMAQNIRYIIIVELNIITGIANRIRARN